MLRQRTIITISLIALLIATITCSDAKVNNNTKYYYAENQDPDQSITVTSQRPKLELLLPHININQGKVVVPELIDALLDEDPEVRAAAAFGLGKIGPEAKTAVPALINGLSDEDIEARSWAAIALGYIGPDSKEAVPELLKALRDDDPSLSGGASVALERIGLNPQQAITIVDMLKDGDSMVRMASAQALKGIGPDAIDILPALIEALGDSHPNVRVFICQAISNLGTNAKSALPKLRLLASEDPFLHPAGVYIVRQVAEEAIAKIEGKSFDDGDSD